ncbi:hypothetical protein EV652_104490 [Kribbella steppae]|uniref:Uncharacterized protein n=1 Tax=Kribbella steppae TaxID=2512223 RepID=A0A4R2HP05_9ACTN|nr:hypothetical protein EV652_104490 [Kribbella steppae]
MKELARVRTRWVSNPHYVNVDLGRREVGFLVLSGDGEVADAVVHDQADADHQALMNEIRRLAEPIVSAAARATTGPR